MMILFMWAHTTIMHHIKLSAFYLTMGSNEGCGVWTSCRYVNEFGTLTLGSLKLFSDLSLNTSHLGVFLFLWLITLKDKIPRVIFKLNSTSCCLQAYLYDPRLCSYKFNCHSHWKMTIRAGWYKFWQKFGPPLSPARAYPDRRTISNPLPQSMPDDLGNLSTTVTRNDVIGAAKVGTAPPN